MLKETLFVCLVPTLLLAQTNWSWIDGKSLQALEGKGFADTESFYDRLPAQAQKTVPAPVWGLSKNSAGMAFHFSTDAARFAVRWTLRSAQLAMPHMPATGVSGVDVYARTDHVWKFVCNGRPKELTNTLTVSLSPDTECLIYLPTYNGITKFEIGLPVATNRLTPCTWKTVKPIVIYGTSITQGGCASRPGMAFTAIMGRIADAPTINLGFSGNGKMELALCDLLAEIDASVYVLDCLWNMNDALVAERAEPFIRSLHKKRPQTPILLAEDCNQWNRQSSKAKRLRTLYEKLKTEDPASWSNLHYLPADGMLGDDGETTVDNCHPNDLGMWRQGQAFGSAVKAILDSARR